MRPDLVLHESSHARISQAHGFKVPGYLIVEPLRDVTSLSELSPQEMADFGESLALAEGLVWKLSSPERVYVLKYGESSARVHFHVIPRTARILEAYLSGREEGPPFSGARITDWLWFHAPELGVSDAEIERFVKAAREAAAQLAPVPLKWRRLAAAAADSCEWAEGEGADEIELDIRMRYPALPMRSFVHAARGLATLFRTQRNAKVHIAAAVAVVGAGFALGVTPGEWCALVLAMGGVLSAEALNTGVEFVCDAVHPDHHPMIGQAKDVAAAGVLIAAIAAVVVGFVVFLPRIT